MHAIDGLILDRRRPPAIGQDNLVGSDEVEADGADGQGGEQDGGVGGGFLEGGEGGVAGGGGEGAVDAGEGEGVGGEGRADDGEEGGPLGEDDGFCGGVLFVGGG